MSLFSVGNMQAIDPLIGIKSVCQSTSEWGSAVSTALASHRTSHKPINYLPHYDLNLECNAKTPAFLGQWLLYWYTHFITVLYDLPMIYGFAFKTLWISFIIIGNNIIQQITYYWDLSETNTKKAFESKLCQPFIKIDVKNI